MRNKRTAIFLIGSFCVSVALASSCKKRQLRKLRSSSVSSESTKDFKGEPKTFLLDINIRGNQKEERFVACVKIENPESPSKATLFAKLSNTGDLSSNTTSSSATSGSSLASSSSPTPTTFITGKPIELQIKSSASSSNDTDSKSSGEKPGPLTFSAEAQGDAQIPSVSFTMYQGKLLGEKLWMIQEDSLDFNGFTKPSEITVLPRIIETTIDSEKSEDAEMALKHVCKF